MQLFSFKSEKFINYINSTRDVHTDIDAANATQTEKDTVHLWFHSLIKKAMYERPLTGKEVALMILNENNPKTMDYYFMKLLGVNLVNAAVSYSGSMSGSLQATNTRITQALGFLKIVKDTTRGQIHFVLDIHDNQIFPKSRNFRITNRRLHPIYIINPKAGQSKETRYVSGFVLKQTEPDEIMVRKYLFLYCRNSWQRKSEIKSTISKSEDKAAEVIAEDTATSNAIDGTVSVI